MKPERENSLVDLLDRLLNKGIILNADLIISVAGVPLIGINLKAALAGIETMLDYGMMEGWDESTREWYEKEIPAKGISLLEGESILIRTFGYIWYGQGIIREWRPGFWYLTNKRLFLWREEMLFETSLEKIETSILKPESHFNKERNVLILQHGGEIARIYLSEIIRFKEAIEKASGKMTGRKEYPLVIA